MYDAQVDDIQTNIKMASYEMVIINRMKHEPKIFSFPRRTSMGVMFRALQDTQSHPQRQSVYDLLHTYVRNQEIHTSWKSSSTVSRSDQGPISMACTDQRATVKAQTQRTSEQTDYVNPRSPPKRTQLSTPRGIVTRSSRNSETSSTPVSVRA
ncbi:hypothetical protein BC827DRAFT_710079 [Russula dissimulans]|jgi:hypothetical protein|nr:hypothetical protein BC827DRAFT_710079 [Russula dissimulans]